MKRKIVIDNFIDIEELEASSYVGVSPGKISEYDDSIIKFYKSFNTEHQFVIRDLLDKKLFYEYIDKWFAVSGEIYFIGETPKDAFDKMRVFNPDLEPYLSKIQTPQGFLDDYKKYKRGE